jgi:hypothetical protein
MMIAFAIATTLLAMLSGVLLAALESPQADAGRLVQRLSTVWVIATFATAASGVAYALLG